MPTLTRFRFLARALGAMLTASAVHAYDLGGIDFHGSLSSTAAYSNRYNFLGDTAHAVDMIQSEATLNGTKRFDNGIKAAAQVYAYDLAGYSAVSIDFANLDYAFSQEFGVRIGKNKTPIGFYSESQDLDQIRTLASLPLNFYPRAYRPFAVSNDGIIFYGNVGASKAGSFDYQLFYGYADRIDAQQPYMLGQTLNQLSANMNNGGSLVWNAPVDGLRLGYTYMTIAGSSLSFPNSTFGDFRGPLNYECHVASIEYTRGKWIAAAEYKHTTSTVEVNNIGLGFIPAGIVPLKSSSKTDNVYLQLTYQATEKVGLGVYYAYSDFGPDDLGNKGGIDKDIAFATSYAIKPWWLVKGEVHFLDGIYSLGTAGDSNPGAPGQTSGRTNGEQSTYFVLKTTLSF